MGAFVIMKRTGDTETGYEWVGYGVEFPYSAHDRKEARDRAEQRLREVRQAEPGVVLQIFERVD